MTTPPAPDLGPTAAPARRTKQGASGAASTSPSKGPSRAGGRKELLRLAAATVLGGLAVLFAVLNFDDVEVNWLLGTWSTPLIVVIVVSFGLGAFVGLLLARRARRT